LNVVSPLHAYACLRSLLPMRLALRPVAVAAHRLIPHWQVCACGAFRYTAAQKDPHSQTAAVASATATAAALAAAAATARRRGSERSNAQKVVGVRVPPEEISYSVVIERRARRGDVQGAALWLQHMTLLFKPNVFVYNAVITAFTKQGNMKEAMKWLNHMVDEEGLEPNIVTYSAVIDCCAKRGDTGGAERWFQVMQERGIEPNTSVSYNAVINSCARCGNWEKALSWLRRMQKHGGPGVLPDTITYNSVIHSCATARPARDSEATQLFREMHEERLHPTASTLSSLTRATSPERCRQLCSELGIDDERAVRHQPPPKHRAVKPLAHNA